MSTLQLSPHISVLPYLHGKAPFSLELRKILWAKKYDCLAFAFPRRFQSEIHLIIEKMPALYALVARTEEESFAYIPADPSDALIEGVRQAIQRRIPYIFLEDDTQIYYKELLTLPDPHLVTHLGIEKYYQVCRPYLADVKQENATRFRAKLCLEELLKLQEKYQNILFLTDLPVQVILDLLPGNLEEKLSALQDAHYAPEERWEDTGPLSHHIFPVNPEHAYFALGELPFYSAQLEKERLDPLASLPSYTELIKKLFTATRDQHMDNPREEYSVTRLQIALQYLRNLCITDNRLTPDLYTIITAAKGVFGAYYARMIFEAARYYPFFELEEAALLNVGVDFVQSPYDSDPVKAVNLLYEDPREWRPLPIHPEPESIQKHRYRYEWDPKGMCSHIQEDLYIESFNKQVRQRTKLKQVENQSRSEKFSTSLKDGIDVRETLRNWHTGSLYVKELPPVPHPVDSVIVLFDTRHDERYPFRTTWYAEHAEESTLTFYATDPLDKLIGPGIARCEYGGFSLLYPPRPIPDVFEHYQNREHKLSLAELLVMGACQTSDEKVITVVSPKPPGYGMQAIAWRWRKKLFWMPLNSYSQETIRKLRRVHILNGKKVRSWASRFIDND